MTTTWESKCRCGNDIFYYPAKLLLETTKDIDNFNLKKRIVSLTCSSCKKIIDYEFPTVFTNRNPQLNRINNNKILT